MRTEHGTQHETQFSEEAKARRTRRITSVRMGPRRPGRMMYQCPRCRKYTYNVVAHRCGKSSTYAGGYGDESVREVLDRGGRR